MDAHTFRDVDDGELDRLWLDVSQERKRRGYEHLATQGCDKSPDPSFGRGNAAGLAYGGAVQHGSITLENVGDCFTYQAWNPDQVAAGEIVREALVAAARAILRAVPAGPDRSVAIRKLREARMDANSAITFGGRF